LDQLPGDYDIPGKFVRQIPKTAIFAKKAENVLTNGKTGPIIGTKYL
jgi:hypothetical protein